MSISRGFVVMGAVYLVVGIVFGAYMGGSGDHTLAPVHAGFPVALVAPAEETKRGLTMIRDCLYG